ncbi:MAG TPA: hypothetical protein VH704_02025 [Casimicrobiaceae bacterium]|jgi:hypothetical protein|nr:hypothetical protein [Casimicrobiaceae bacterium]
MPTRRTFAFLIASLAVLGVLDAHAGKSTVCTVTVNSPNEKETLRRVLPEDKFQFVELVERGRPDWLASACRENLRCDVLVVSGHFDGGTEFYSDRLDARESLPVAELERASCSASCAGLFSQLKEVYLFGCNTLNAATPDSTAAEIARSLVRAGYSSADAERVSRALNQRHGESNREGMRRIFAKVPVIYGFSAMAPLGAAAAPLLSRHLTSSAAGEFGSGRASSSLLGQFAGSSMTATAGLGDADPRASYRREVCEFFDEQRSPAQKLAFIHRVLGRDMAEVRMFFERIEAFYASLTEEDRQAPAFIQESDEIARDQLARDRYMTFARDVDRPQVRSRMVRVARTLGWLSPEDEKAEIARMLSELLAGRSIGSAEVDLVCSLNKDRSLDDQLRRLERSPLREGVADAALLACLGSTEDRERVLRALTARTDAEVEIARVYLHHHPITDVNELRDVAARIARMTESDAQVRALDTLAHYYLADRESLDQLTRLFPVATSVNVQRAIAGVFIRSDYRSLPRQDLVRMLREHRIKSPDGEDVIDVLIRRLQA